MSIFYKYLPYFILAIIVQQSFAMELSENIDLLVVGSTRENNMNENAIMDLVHGDEAKFAYEEKIAGDAVTIDLKPSTHPRHVQGDAKQYNFSPRIIKRLFIERMYTAEGDSFVPGEHNNLIGAILKNFHPQMVDGASLTIELDPCLKLFMRHKSHEDIEMFRKANPFHAWQNYDVALAALVTLNAEKSSEQELRERFFEDGHPEENHDEILALRAQLIEWVNKLVAITGISFADLSRKVYQEMLIYNSLYCEDSRDLPGIQITCLFPRGASLCIADFDRSFKSRFGFRIMPSERDFYVRQKIIDGFDYYGGPARFWCYDRSEFFPDTLSNALLAFAAVEHNKHHIIEYLESIGFTNVTIEMNDSYYTGRKNFWIVNAVKK